MVMRFIFFLTPEQTEVPTMIILASCGVCSSILTWTKHFIQKWRMFFFISLFPGFLFEFASEGDFKCSGDLHDVDTVLKAEGSTHSPDHASLWQMAVCFCLKWDGAFPVQSLAPVQTPGSSNLLPACLKFHSQCISSGNQLTEQRASLICETITAATFSHFRSDQTCKTSTFLLFSELRFLLMPCSCSEFILIFSTVQCPNPAT